MKQILQKRIFPVLVCLVFIVVLAIPSYADDIEDYHRFWNWEDYIADSEIIGDSKYTTVIFPLDSVDPYVHFGLWTYSWGTVPDVTANVSATNYMVSIPWPGGDSVLSNGIRAVYRPFGNVIPYASQTGLYVDNIPNDTSLAFDLSISYSQAGALSMDPGNIKVKVEYYCWVSGSDITNLRTDTFSFETVEGGFEGSEYVVSLPFEFNLDKPDTCNTIAIYVDLGVIGLTVEEGTTATLELAASPLEMTFETSVMADLLEKLDKNNQTMQLINDKLGVNNSWLEKIWTDFSSWYQQILDAINAIADMISSGVTDSIAKIETTVTDIFTGGDAGDDLISGSDDLENAGSGLQEDLDQIQDFEDQYMADFDNNMDEIAAAVDLTTLTAPLNFVWGYTNKAVAAVPSQYLVVFTLPALIGIFLFIIGHPVRAPRPDTSGDQVTRETFTETTILTGKHAGETRSTRTVTTTQEIGRVRNE